MVQTHNEDICSHNEHAENGQHLLAIDGRVLAVIGAVEKLAVEQLHTDDGEDELEQYVHDENIYNVLQ